MKISLFFRLSCSLNKETKETGKSLVTSFVVDFPKEFNFTIQVKNTKITSALKFDENNNSGRPSPPPTRSPILDRRGNRELNCSRKKKKERKESSG